MADAPPLPGQVNRCYVSATAFPEDTATDAAFFTALGSATRIDNMLSNAKRTDSRKSAELSERGRDFEATLTGKRAIGFSCKITKRPGSTGYDLLKTAYCANAPIAVALSTGDIATTGTKAMCFNGIITKWDSDEPDPGATTHDMEIMVSALSVVPPTEATKAA